MTRAGCSAGLALDEIVEFGNAGRGMPGLREIREARGLSSGEARRSGGRVAATK